MIWTPEIFGGFVMAGVLGVGALKKAGLLSLDWTRNSKPNAKIDDLEDKSVRSETRIDEHEKRLDKHDISFKEMFDKVANTDTNVGKLLERTDTILRIMK